MNTVNTTRQIKVHRTPKGTEYHKRIIYSGQKIYNKVKNTTNEARNLVIMNNLLSL